jgi:hypothetical protein
MGRIPYSTRQGRSYSSSPKGRRYANGVSRLIRQCLLARMQLGLTQRPQADPRLPQGYIFAARSPWIYSNGASLLGLRLSRTLMFLRQASYCYFGLACMFHTVGRVIDHLYISIDRHTLYVYL